MSNQASASRALHRAEQLGMAIVAADDAPPEVRNRPVEYVPRVRNDWRPWRPVDGPYWVRLSGKQCKAVQR